MKLYAGWYGEFNESESYSWWCGTPAVGNTNIFGNAYDTFYASFYPTPGQAFQRHVGYVFPGSGATNLVADMWSLTDWGWYVTGSVNALMT